MALLKRFDVSRRHDRYCAAMTAAAIYNVHRKEGTEAITPEKLLGEAIEKEEKRMTVEDTKLTVQMLAEAFGGTVTTG